MITKGADSRKSKAGVVGSGIAGLCAAIALRRAGWEVEIFEKSQSKSQVGAAITVSPPTVALLTHWGFDFSKAGPVEISKISVQLSHNLQMVYDERFPNLEQTYGHNAYSLHRVDLYRGLLELAEEENDDLNTKGPPAVVREVGVKQVDCNDGVIFLQDQTRVEKDLIVVADGAHSRLLERFVDSPCPQEPTGRSLYRILTSMDDVLSDSDLRQFYEDKLSGFTCFFDPIDDVFFINYPCRDSTILNSAIVHNTASPDDMDSSWSRQSSVAEALQCLKNFHPTLQKYIRLANDEDIKIHDTYKHRPLDSFVKGRALILGDAAHAMLPGMAWGAAVAIEAASTLEPLFRSVSGDDTKTVSERLVMFDKMAIPRCNMVMLLSNAGNGGHGDPKVQAEVRKYYPHPLPPADAGIWSEPFREMLFGYDSLAEAEKLLSDAAKA